MPTAETFWNEITKGYDASRTRCFFQSVPVSTTEALGLKWIQTNEEEDTNKSTTTKNEFTQLSCDLKTARIDQDGTIITLSEPPCVEGLNPTTVVRVEGRGNFKPHVQPATLKKENKDEEKENPSVYAHDVILPSPIGDVYTRFDETTELYFRNWTFMSIHDIKERKKEFEERSQYRITPMAFQYRGMGHVCVLAYAPATRTIFTYMDGGSSSYDRQDNLNAIVSFDDNDIASRATSLDVVFEE